MLLSSYPRYHVTTKYSASNQIRYSFGYNGVRNSRRSRFFPGIRRNMAESGVDDGCTTIEGDPRPHLDDSYSPELIAEVCRFGAFKPSGSLLVVGGGNWQFAKSAWQACGAETCVYADDDHASVRLADQEEGTLTIDCDDVAEPETLAKLGKYDEVVVKNVFERLLTSDEDIEEYLEEFFESMYKVMKYGGRAVLILRLDFASIPMPEEVSKIFSKNASKLTLALAKQYAAKQEFGIKHKSLKFHVCLGKEIYGKVLSGGRMFKSFPALSEESAEKFLADLSGDNVEFEDKLDLLLLCKEISED